MSFKPVILWTDALVYVLVAVIVIFAWHVRRNEHLLAPWRRVGHSASGMAALTILIFFIAIGLLDSVHLRPAVENSNGGNGEKAYSVEVLSLLDVIATPLRTHVEKTYSAPFAAYLYARETVELPDGGQVREFPRLKFGGSASAGSRSSACRRYCLRRAGAGGGLGLLLWCLIVDLVNRVVAHRRGKNFFHAFRHLAWYYGRSMECDFRDACIDAVTMWAPRWHYAAITTFLVPTRWGRTYFTSR